MGCPDRKQWYVLRTKPRAEVAATCHLERKQIGVFFPRFAAPEARGLRISRHRERSEPLFPGYLFVHLDLASEYYSAAWTPGIRDFLKLGAAEPQPVGDDVVACLRSRADEKDVVRPRLRFRIGDRVEVTSGPFSGLLAVIDRPCTASGRIHVLLDLLRRRTGLELPVSAVAPA
jgi:transcriptional antiterminator RfaH